MERIFTLEYWIDDRWYVGRLREIPGVFSQGETLAELEDNIADAYRMVAADSADYKPSAEIQRKELVLRV
jgi:predicted RNase H-like HicB family nuclease